MENLAYMKSQEAWPAYHGFGGAYELDIAKIFDALATSGNPADAFDLAIDMGANFGYYTEKMTARKFAKNYILIEANPGAVNPLRSRWGDPAWRQRWFTEQIPLRAEDPVPNFEIIHQALSSTDGGIIDLCQTEGSMSTSGCNVMVASVDHIIPDRLTPAFQDVVRSAQSAFVKIDTEGMDELVLRGMGKLLQEQRGQNEDGTPRYLVNFLQFEYSPQLTKQAKDREGIPEYSLKTVTQFLESVGFESFFIGPRFLPLSHGSWDDDFAAFTEDPRNNAGRLDTFPNFDRRIMHQCYVDDCATISSPMMTGDIFAIRATHPRATELKVALGACQESLDFDASDPRYVSPL